MTISLLNEVKKGVQFEINWTDLKKGLIEMGTSVSPMLSQRSTTKMQRSFEDILFLTNWFPGRLIAPTLVIAVSE